MSPPDDQASSTRPTRLLGLTEAQTERLVDATISLLRRTAGASSPMTVDAVLTTRGRYYEVIDSQLMGGSTTLPVVLETIAGWFYVRHSMPAGQQVRAATLLTLVFDPATGAVTDWGCQSAAIGLSCFEHRTRFTLDSW